MGLTPERTVLASGAYPTPPSSASPSRERFPREPPAHSNAQWAAGSPTGSAGRRRATSLSSRYPGDQTHRPLQMLTRETKAAYRSPHLRDRHIPPPDAIDVLDNVMGSYHHEGPFDAALWARNISPQTSPLEAVRSTNEEALRATPPEKIQDSLERHRPLDGVAIIPPGMKDLAGNEMRYEEGPNLMIEDGGDYKRWPGVDYHPNDIKGKGEPSYSIELALKQAGRDDHHRRIVSEGDATYELATRARPASSHGRDGVGAVGTPAPHEDWQGDLRRSHTTGRRVRLGLTKPFGSLRRRNRP